MGLIFQNIEEKNNPETAMIQIEKKFIMYSYIIHFLKRMIPDSPESEVIFSTGNYPILWLWTDHKPYVYLLKREMRSKYLHGYMITTV